MVLGHKKNDSIATTWCSDEAVLAYNGETQTHSMQGGASQWVLVGAAQKAAGCLHCGKHIDPPY